MLSSWCSFCQSFGDKLELIIHEASHYLPPPTQDPPPMKDRQVRQGNGGLSSVPSYLTSFEHLDIQVSADRLAEPYSSPATDDT